MFLPCPIIAASAHFQPLFTAPTWKKVVPLLLGTMLARGDAPLPCSSSQIHHLFLLQYCPGLARHDVVS